jgi:hypothetical protein
MTHEIWQIKCLVFTPWASIAILDGSEPDRYDGVSLSEQHLAITRKKHRSGKGDIEPGF